MRRVWLGEPQEDGRPWATAEGVAGENFETEVYQFYGLSAGVGGEGALMSFNGRADNHTALPPRGDRLAKAGTVLLYYGQNTEIELTKDSVTIRLAGGNFTMKNGKITTNMDIETTGDVKAGGVSLRRHIHTGVTSGGGVTGLPKP